MSVSSFWGKTSLNPDCPREATGPRGEPWPGADGRGWATGLRPLENPSCLLVAAGRRDCGFFLPGPATLEGPAWARTGEKRAGARGAWGRV